MGDYRAYLLGIDGQPFVMADNFLRDHPNDDSAIQAAKKLTDKHVVEVWERCRLVAELLPDGHSFQSWRPPWCLLVVSTSLLPPS